MAEYDDVVRKLRTENRELQRGVAEQARHIQTQTMGFAEELDRLRSQAFVDAPKVSDSEIQAQWRNLNFSIRQFVSRYLPGSLGGPTVQRLAQQEIFKCLPDMEKTMQLPLLCPVILESWIWHFLCIRLFDSHSDFWAGDIGQAFSKMCDQTRNLISHNCEPSTPAAAASLVQFHDWRVRLAHFISELENHNKDSKVMHTVESMLQGLNFITASMSPDIRLEMHHDALAIVRKAAELDKIFRLARADFHVFITRVKLPLVQPPSFGFKFDPETMESIKDIPIVAYGNPADQLPVVDLAVSPGIFKAGNSDGADYESERVLVKLQALCNLQTILGFFDGGKVTEDASDREQPKIKEEETEADGEVDMLPYYQPAGQELPLRD
ncbi:hypothetical protein VTK56DRAFT_4290 [Thermocarpiscus australiensis]